MAKAPMTDKLDDAITRLSELSGWPPEKSANHVAGLALALVDKAEDKAATAARRIFEKPTAKKRGRGQAAAQ